MSSFQDNNAENSPPPDTDMVNLEKAKDYMKKKVDPIMSELLRKLVVDQPNDVLKYVVAFFNAKREDDPELRAKREEVARQFGQQIERPVTPPGKYDRKDYGGRHVSYSGTLGGGGTTGGAGKTGSKEDEEGATPKKVLTAAERREAMLAAAEKRGQANAERGGKISDAKSAKMAEQRKKDVLLGKIRALYSASGRDEPFGLGMAKIEILEMHYDRARGLAQGYAKQTAKEDKVRNVRLN
jgi:hypothetical protein